MNSDSPIVEEVRRQPMEISERFGEDLHAYIEHLRREQKRYRDRLVGQVTVVPTRSEAVRPATKGK